ncbi:MAG: ATP synthase F1 subunit delta [Treponema sp.]|jgi:F-type H+-transporting ATPase subunit delta|nr:ATP synthase F1 subunit delta [Treponema sp.]
MARLDYRTRQWALAFINRCSGTGGIDETLELLEVLIPVIKKIPGRLAGAALSKRVEKLVREGALKTGAGEGLSVLCGRFLALLIQKNFFGRVDAVMEEIQKIADAKRGILPVYAESAFPLEGEEKRELIEGIKRISGAGEVRLESVVNPELLGGYRLRIGAELIDASIKGQLQKMAAELAAGEP